MKSTLSVYGFWSSPKPYIMWRSSLENNRFLESSFTSNSTSSSVCPSLLCLKDKGTVLMINYKQDGRTKRTWSAESSGPWIPEEEELAIIPHSSTFLLPVPQSTGNPIHLEREDKCNNSINLQSILPILIFSKMQMWESEWKRRAVEASLVGNLTATGGWVVLILLLEQFFLIKINGCK